MILSMISVSVSTHDYVDVDLLMQKMEVINGILFWLFLIWIDLLDLLKVLDLVFFLGKIIRRSLICISLLMMILVDVPS